MNIATHHLYHAARLIDAGLPLIDRKPDEAAEHFRDARRFQTLAENILLRLQLGEFADD